VAAYIVETLTGERFEDFVADNLFRPIGMTSATYFPPASAAAATQYRNDGTSPSPYWHMLFRPSGAIHASARDMAVYLRFLLDRGMTQDTRIVAAAGIDRMETPHSTWGARIGLTTGYGLTTGSLIRDGFLWHGHSGEIPGGLSELGYVPAYGIGYFTSVNSDNGFDSFRIGQSIRRYLTRGLSAPPLPPRMPLPATINEFTGWYEPASPRSQLLFFLQRLTGLRRLRVERDELILGDGDAARRYVAVASGLFRRVFPSGPQDPAPTLAVLANEEGRFVQTGTEAETLKKIPFWLVVFELTLVLYVAVSVAAIVLHGLVWVVLALRSRRTSSEWLLHLWPLTSLAVVAAAVLAAAATDDPITSLGNATPVSVGLWLASLLFGIAAIGHALIAWRAPRGIAVSGRRFALGIAPALLIAAGYLGYWGILGLRTWAR
jgi:hypothetical protein